MASGNPDRENVPSNVRKKMLRRENYKCELCGGRCIEKGGNKILEVHHQTYDPEGYDVHDEENLTVLCIQCHNWTHKQPQPEALPIDVSEEAANKMLPHDFEIISILHKKGLLSTPELKDELTADLTHPAVRERCWVMMGLSEIIPDVDEPLINQDVKTGKWGLSGQIDHPERGRIPESDQRLIQRIHDERVYRALERTGDRDLVAEVFGIAPRTVLHKEKRALAYKFPLDALESSAGRPRKEDTDTE